MRCTGVRARTLILKSYVELSVGRSTNFTTSIEMEWNTVKSPSQSQRQRNCNSSQIVATRLNKLRSPLREFVFMVSHHRATDECEEVRRVRMCRALFHIRFNRLTFRFNLLLLINCWRANCFRILMSSLSSPMAMKWKKKPKQNKIPNTIKINVWHWSREKYWIYLLMINRCLQKWWAQIGAGPFNE